MRRWNSIRRRQAHAGFLPVRVALAQVLWDTGEKVAAVDQLRRPADRPACTRPLAKPSPAQRYPPLARLGGFDVG